MANFVLIPGADGRAWFWHRLVPILRAAGHEAIAVDLPPEATADLDEYTDAVVAAAGDRTPVVLVAHSLGAFTGPLACARLPVELLVLTNPMVPTPGESVGQWWANTGQQEASAAYAREHGRQPEFEVRRDFFHDVPEEITAQAFADESGSAKLDGVFAQRWPAKAWPDVPTRVLQGRDDRFFPLEFQRRIARERLGMRQIDDMPGGHLFALSQPEELAARLIAYIS